ncbi:hypothetical protein P154DRAFT_623897 [Amniculicola lignicola CBS 123094]|uniref:Uncharacterized protein n=1 Tax=Amniculicola lignicola CBS 123094 TaxID=1392246 RepID=A0A6A5W1A0_9PLEO|nr:hypothetical protein P154DRAFT_623897 [Amniculicola lignicola CBS 123094]
MLALPLSVLLLIQSVLAGRPSSAPTITGTTVLEDLLLPFPYAPASAKFFASIAGVQTDATIYAITCIPPSNISPAATATQPNACQPNAPSVTFGQGLSTWYMRNFDPADESPTGDLHRTACSTDFSSSEIDCDSMDQVGGGKKQYKEGKAWEDFGLRMAEEGVTVTAGWELIGDPGTQIEATSTAADYSFTDVGATKTKSGPVVTVTLVKSQPGTGARTSLVDYRLLGIAGLAIWAVFIAL